MTALIYTLYVKKKTGLCYNFATCRQPAYQKKSRHQSGVPACI